MSLSYFTNTYKHICFSIIFVFIQSTIVYNIAQSFAQWYHNKYHLDIIEIYIYNGLPLNSGLVWLSSIFNVDIKWKATTA